MVPVGQQRPRSSQAVLVPQRAPAAQLGSAQSTWPSQSSSTPLLQFSAGQATHWPPAQRLPVPHRVPSGRLEARQRPSPPLQLIFPCWHGLPVSQAAPWLQLTQLPPRQVALGPQAVPSAAAPVSVQRDDPLSQEVRPTLHRAGSQAASGWQATQAPALHTMALPQDLPSGALPLS
jgi:hypothetical protein